MSEKTIDRAYIAAGLRRPSTEYLRDGVEVFIAATIEGNASMLYGEPYIHVLVGRDGHLKCGTSAPLNCVTVAAGYAPADELRRAEYRLRNLERQIEAIKEVVGAPVNDGQATVERVRLILEPTPETEDDE